MGSLLMEMKQLPGDQTISSSTLDNNNEHWYDNSSSNMSSDDEVNETQPLAPAADYHRKQPLAPAVDYHRKQEEYNIKSDEEENLLNDLPGVAEIIVEDGLTSKDHNGGQLKEDMGKFYSPESGSDGDVETDPNMDFSHKRKSSAYKGATRFSINSSIDSLDDNQAGQSEDDITISPHSHNDDITMSTLEMDRGHHMFNIPPPPTSHMHDTFLPLGNGAAPSNESSGSCSHHSCTHHNHQHHHQHQHSGSMRDTDSDNNRQNSSEYQTTNLLRIQPTRPIHMAESFPHACQYCHDNQLHSMSSQGRHHAACCGSMSAHTPGSWSHYHRNIPASQTSGNMARSSTASSHYQGTNYEPPWDLVYPSLSQIGVLPQRMPNCNHDNMCSHNSRGSSGALHTSHKDRGSNNAVSRSTSSHDRQALTQGQRSNTIGRNNGLNTLATTTGSHNYEIPWDVHTDDGSSSKILAYWQSRQTLNSRKLNDTVGCATPAVERHMPPPCSPPPPPPSTDIRQPGTHYDALALQESNFVHKLPTKKKVRRCDWKCISIFLLLAVLALAACVSAFTYLLVDRSKSAKVSQSKGANNQLTPVTDGNLGDRHRSEISPYDFIKVRFYVSKSAFYKFNITLRREAVLGVYGRRGIQPTHIQYEFLERIFGQQIASSQSRRRRSVDTAGSNTAFVHYLDEGYWYLSFYNDGPDPESIRFTAGIHDKMSTNCPNDCYGRGDCNDGRCQCYPGYTGVDCNLNVCPVLCSRNGIYEGGICRCFDGWKGVECSVQSHHCTSCSVHGRCLDGECVCEEGWKGESCDELDCPDKDCSGHGLCYQGQCYCEMGYRGLSCGINESKNFTIACSNNCSGRGTFDALLQLCKCDEGWMGDDCSEKKCSHSCNHGTCSDGKCVCDKMWTGVTCTEKQCDSRCSLHGECNNGTCVCQPGWNGKHCSLNGCPSNCNDHGDCTKVDGQFICLCESGWKGKACDIQVELTCNDDVDNDGDNLIDCLDPDCCVADVCSSAAFCQLSPDPIAILQTAPKLHTMASFYESKRFLVEADGAVSVQRPGDISTFDPMRVSVIRGQVLLKDGSPALGTRVEIAMHSIAGFTLTRENGTFDIMVNGGGSITILFIRGSALPANTTVIVPWNSLVTLDPVTLLQPGDTPDAELTCDPGHDRYTLYPTVLPTWQHSQLRACPEASVIIPESQVAQESLSIPGTDLHLLYKTADTSGYRSMILIQLTPSVIPDNLALVHLRVVVEGNVETKVFEADPNLTYRYAWNRQNAYQQNVYGIVSAEVSVGYQYTGCNRVFWDRQATTLSGFLGGDLSSSNRAISKGWSLDIQHFYNYQEGILHKGDGTNIYLKEKPRQLVTVLGNGLRREHKCTSCDGQAANKKLLAPVAIASDLDGAVFVADYNMIRRLSVGMETVTSVLELSGSSTSYRYYMTVSPVDGSLYLTDFQNKQVIKVKDPLPEGRNVDITTNYKIVAGTGLACERGGTSKCGDGGAAKQAQLTHPKGIAVNKYGEIYFVDDTTVRKIDKDGIINTIIGSQTQPGQYVPIPCGRSAELYEVYLGWPTSIAFSPIDGSLHILDSSTNLVLKITSENKVVIVAGRPTHCPEINLKKSGLGLLGESFLQTQRARDTDLVALKSMTFAPNGDLYLVESDERMINRIRLVSTDGYISHYAGGMPECNCRKPTCQCYDPKETVAAKALLNNPSSVTVTPNGVLYIADMGNLRVHSVVTILPKPKHTHYSVISSEEGQIYKFDRNGFHIQTIDVMTNRILYNFTMKPRNSLQGALTQVSGVGGHVIDFHRDSSAKLKYITLNGVKVCNIKVNQNRELYKYIDWNNMSTEYSYELYTGLIKNKLTSKGELYFYDYDTTGRLSEVIASTGEVINLEATVDSKGAKITLTENDAVSGTATYNGNSLSLWHGKRSADVTYSNDGSLVVEYPSGLVVTLETGSHPTFSGEAPTTLKRKIISSSDGPVHRLEWRYYLRKSSPRRLGRKFRVSGSQHDYNKKHLMVNGENLLSFEYLEGVNLESVKSGIDASHLVSVLYNSAGWPIFIAGNSSIFSVNLTYNTAGQLTRWKHGQYEELRNYTQSGQLETVKKSFDVITRYLYNHGGSQPSDVFLPSKVQYQIKYDKFGNIIQLITPSAQVHTFQKSLNLGFIRQGYSITAGISSKTYWEDINNAGQLIRRIYPTTYRRLYQRYSIDGRISEVLYDTDRILYSYDTVTHSLNSVVLNKDLYDCTLEYKTNGSLYDQHRLLIKSKLAHLKFADVSYRYKYNKLLRVTEVTATLNDGSTRLSFTLNFDYSHITGFISKIGDFSIVKYVSESATRVTLNDAAVTIIRGYNKANLLSTVELLVNNQRVSYSTLRYNNLRLIDRWYINMTNYEQSTTYSYNTDSNVVKVNVNTNKEYEYKYNGQASLTEVISTGIVRRIHVDSLERVTYYNNESYQFDADGFLISKGDVKYQFNSKGQLIHVLQNGKVDIAYFYDGAGRLLSRKDNYGSTIQFLYADIMRPSRVTQMYNFTSHTLTSMTYDDRGYIISLDIGTTRYYVIPDHSGTPVAMFDRSGNLIKRLEYTVFGEVILDTRPDINIFLGFQGGFHDPVTRLVYLTERWYYPKLGRWMDSNLPNIFNQISRLAESPALINRYQYEAPLNLHTLDYNSMYKKDVRSWLETLGYNLDTLAPRTSFEGQLIDGRVIPSSHQALLPLVSAFQCAYEQDMDSFLELSVVNPSKLTTSKHDRTIKTLTPSGTLFSPGIVLSVSRGVVHTKVYGVAPQQETLLATKVINGSQCLYLNYTFTGKVIHYFVKEDLSLFNDDLKTLGMQSSSSLYLENNARVKVARVQHKSSQTKRIIQQAQLIIEGNSTEINIRYGTSRDDEYKRVLEVAYNRAVRYAWLNELKVVTDGRRSQYHWTASEVNELKKKGLILGYKAELVRSADQYPELAGDPTNIRFVKQ